MLIVPAYLDSEKWEAASQDYVRSEQLHGKGAPGIIERSREA